MIAVSELPDLDSGAEPGARWSASAAAFMAWRDGDPEALDELVGLLSPTLWQVVRATGVDRATAEDVVQNTWLTFVDKADTIVNPMAVAGWLCTTARRDGWRASRQARRERATEETSLHAVLPDAEPADARIVLEEEQEILRGCLTRLSDRCQSLLRMLAAGPRPDYAEVSATLEIPVGSIGPTRARCLDKLRGELLREGAL